MFGRAASSVTKMIDSYLGNDLYMAETETELSMLSGAYWQVQAKREIEDAIVEVRGDKRISSLDIWVRKMLLEQEQMRYGRRWRKNRKHRRTREGTEDGGYDSLE